MTLPEDPPRLIDEPGEGFGELKLGLERMSSNLPTAEQLGRMAVHVNVAPNGGAGNGVPRGSNTLLKVAVGAGISGAVLWALLHGTSSAPELDQKGASRAAPSSTSLVEGFPHIARSAPSPASRAPIPVVSRPEPAAPNADAPTAPPIPAAEPQPTLRPTDGSAPSSKAPPAIPTAISKPSRNAPASTSGASSASTGSRAASPAPAKPPVAAVPSEMELLRDARLALSGDPARALTLTEQHRREYPSGGFSQEREVIAITALARLGRAAEARSRAERFRAAYPTSPYIDRLNRTVPP